MAPLSLSYAFNLFTKTKVGSVLNDSLQGNPVVLDNDQLTNGKDFAYSIQLSPNESKTLNLLNIDIVGLRVLLIYVKEGRPVSVNFNNEGASSCSVYFKDFAITGVPQEIPPQLELVITNVSNILLNVRVTGVGY
jgi:hypothetical protein